MLGRTFRSCTFLLLSLPWASGAIEFRAGDVVTVAVDEVITGDLYASGDTVTIAGVVRGDVVVAAREVQLTGSAEGDFIAAGQVVVVAGTVGDDVRVAGMALQLTGDSIIVDHVVSAGYSLEVEAGSQVGGEFVFTGAKALLAGDFDSAVRIAAAGVEIDGRIAGGVEARAAGGLGGTSWFESFAPIPMPSVADGLTVTDAARIDGPLSYSAPDEVEIPVGTVGGGVKWDPESPREVSAVGEEVQPTLLSRMGDAARRFLALLVVGLLLLWRAPKWTDGRIDELTSSPLRSLGWGITSYLGTPLVALGILIATLLLAVLVGNLALGRLSLLVVLPGVALLVVLLAGFFLSTLFGAPIIASAGVGRSLLRRFDSDQRSAPYLSLAIGLALLILLTSLPRVGWALGLAAVAAGLGPLVRWLAEILRSGALLCRAPVE